MNEPITHINPNYLVDTGVFVAWARRETAAREFFHHPPGRIYFPEGFSINVIMNYGIPCSLRSVVYFVNHFLNIFGDFLNEIIDIRHMPSYTLKNLM